MTKSNQYTLYIDNDGENTTVEHIRYAYRRQHKYQVI